MRNNNKNHQIKMTNKKTHHDSLNVEQTLISSEAFIDKYKKPIMYVFIAIIVLVGGYFLYRHFISEPRAAKANELMYKGQQYFASDDYEKALNGDGQGFPGFVKIASEYGSSKAGNLAKLYAGLSYAKTGKYQEAVKELEEFSSCNDEMISPAALGALGNCYAELNQLDKATSTLMEAAKKADNNSLSPIYLMQAGKIFEAQGQKDKALECYQEIKTKYVNSMQYGEIDKYIERASK